MREKLIELLTEPIPITDSILGDECVPKMKMVLSFAEKVADHLIANGVTITPAVPGPKMGHDMSEVCYRNCGEAMREKVVELLKDCKAAAFGARRDEIQDMIEKVRKL